MVDVLTEIVIDCPVQEVSSFAGDPLNATKWYVNIKEARLMTPFMANAMRKANTKDLQRLKSLLEKK